MALSLVLVGTMTLAASADIVVTLYENTYSQSGNPLNALLPGDIVVFEIAVGVVDDGSNMGLATLVYDVSSAEANAKGYWLNVMTPAESGYAENSDGSVGALRDITNSLYVNSGTSEYAGYNGGWGFDNSGLPTGGDATTNPGEISTAGALMPLTWDADINPAYPGLQPYSRLGVGHGTYTFPAADLKVGGMQGGFGQVLENVYPNPPTPGDGHWLFQRSTIDTNAWDFGTYSFDIDGTNAAVYTPTLDYDQDQSGGFRLSVSNDRMQDTSFSFTLIPEPTTLGLIVFGGLGMIAARRRR